MIIKTPIADMNHEEWLEERKKTIGGSEIGAILGMNPWQSAYSLWAERTGRIPAFDGNLQTKMGTFLEEFVARLFEESSGKKVQRTNYIYRNDDYPILHASPDRLLVGEDAGLEIKTTSAYNSGKFKGEDFPGQYYAQAVQYMMVTQRRQWYIAVLVGNTDFHIYHLHRDPMDKPDCCDGSLLVTDGEMTALYKAAVDFMDCLVRDVPPALDGSEATHDALASVYSQGGETPKQLYGRDGMVERWLQLKKQIAVLTDEKDEIQNVLCADLGNSEEGTAGAHKVKWTIKAGRQTFDHKAAVAANPALASYYKTSAPTRAFSIK
jgi:putative phage-type endonuclease